MSWDKNPSAEPRLLPPCPSVPCCPHQPAEGFPVTGVLCSCREGFKTALGLSTLKLMGCADGGTFISTRQNRARLHSSLWATTSVFFFFFFELSQSGVRKCYLCIAAGLSSSTNAEFSSLTKPRGERMQQGTLPCLPPPPNLGAPNLSQDEDNPAGWLPASLTPWMATPGNGAVKDNVSLAKEKEISSLGRARSLQTGGTEAKRGNRRNEKLPNFFAFWLRSALDPCFQVVFSFWGYLALGKEATGSRIVIKP